MKSFTTLQNLFTSLSLNTSSANQTLGNQLINDAHRYLLQKYFNNELTSTAQTVSQQQLYNVPANYSKMKTVTITVGNLKWTLTEVLTRREWDELNVFPYYSSIPVNFFMWDSNTVGIWPIPSTGSTDLGYTSLVGTLTAGDSITAPNGVVGTITAVSSTTMTMAIPASSSNSSIVANTGAYTDSTSGATFTVTNTDVTAGNTITYNYKIRVPDLTFADYTTGTITMTSGSSSVTGAGAGQAWQSNYLGTGTNATNLNLYLQPTAPKGDNNWYPITTISATTTISLANVYSSTNPTASGVSYTIGQMPLLNEDFHDLLVYRPLMIYYTAINPDEAKAAQFKDMYEEGEKRLAEYSGSKTVDVNLGRRPNMQNPNLFYQGQ